LISQRVYAGVEAFVEVEDLQQLNLKGFHRPVVSYSVRGLKA
jgi:class 3 adenylate cyclase